MKRLAGLSVLAVLTVAVSIPAQESAGPATHPYYPLKIGSVWTYKVQGGPIQVKVAGTEKAGTQSGYKLETTAAGKVSATEVVALTNEGVQRFSVNQLNAEPPILFLPKDVEATKEWNVNSKVAGQDISGTFKLDKEKVTVPAGTYDTIHVKGTDMTIGATKTTVEYWFAKDVGIVKLRFTLGTQDAVLELESYTAGK
jgi:hypothetical protein